LNNLRLHIIGELCRLLEIARMVTALSRKPAILAVPVQARQAAPKCRVGCKSGWKEAARLSAICNRTNLTAAAGEFNRRGATAVKSQQVSGYPDRLVFCLSERAT
jgi:hypothetical protein